MLTDARIKVEGEGEDEGDSGPVRFVDSPEPYIFTIDMARFKSRNTAATFNELVTALTALTAPRVVLNVIDTTLSAVEKTGSGGRRGAAGSPSVQAAVFRLTRHHHIIDEVYNTTDVGTVTEENLSLDAIREEFRGGPTDLVAWAKDSVSSWNSVDDSVVKKYTYVPFTLGRSSVPLDSGLEQFRLCGSILVRQYGNRSCFDICK